MTVNPFDLKSALLAKHAQHVVLIHFPIALFISSVAFDLLAIWRNSHSLARAAYYNLIAAAITALAAVITGMLAWQLQLEGERLRGNLRLHLSLGASAAVLIWTSRGGEDAKSSGIAAVWLSDIGHSHLSLSSSLR